MANNPDAIVELSRQAINDVLASVGSAGDLLDDEVKSRTVMGIAARMDQLGADMNATIGGDLARAYMDGLSSADPLMKQVGKDVTVSGINQAYHIAAVDQIVGDTMTDLNAAIRTAKRDSIEKIDQVLDGVKNEIGKGLIMGEGSLVASDRVMEQFASNGMTSFITSDGKALPLDFYAQTVTRTKYRQANTDGACNRYREAGVYHVQVDETGSTCPVCSLYEGMVIALDEEHAEGFPVGGIDVPLPPYHPNCEHTVRPYMMEYHSTADIERQKEKWEDFDPEQDNRTEAEKNLYDQTQAIRREARAEEKEYAILKATAGPDDDIPATLGAFRRQKRKDDKKWNQLQSDYKKNVKVFDDEGPGPGTPRRKAGVSMGPKRTPPKKTRIAPKRSKSDPVGKTPTPVIPPKGKAAPTKHKASTTKMTKADKVAQKNFDKAIDGVEYINRRKTSQQLINSIPGNNMRVAVKKIGANGHVLPAVRSDGKITIKEFALRSNDVRPEQYQWKTMFHEFYHANLEGVDHSPGMFGANWTMWEETATETAALFMTRRAGFNVSDLSPSYAEHLVRTLPALKQLDEFKDANSLPDFGAKFMKYRFDPDHKTSSWTQYAEQLNAAVRDFDPGEYFKTNYQQHLKSGDLDRYTNILFDSLQQADKLTNESLYKTMLKTGLQNAASTGNYTREAKMILPVLMNEIGVREP
ncbi:minor capsid protein 2 [Bacillus phage vB_BpsM-61]|nr:minor capsid protein 2 [Bacillus phage vB_BpsM-61]